jgi:hypothetical protein
VDGLLAEEELRFCLHGLGVPACILMGLLAQVYLFNFAFAFCDIWLKSRAEQKMTI